MSVSKECRDYCIKQQVKIDLKITHLNLDLLYQTEEIAMSMGFCRDRKARFNELKEELVQLHGSLQGSDLRKIARYSNHVVKLACEYVRTLESELFIILDE